METLHKNLNIWLRLSTLSVRKSENLVLNITYNKIFAFHLGVYSAMKYYQNYKPN